MHNYKGQYSKSNNHPLESVDLNDKNNDEDKITPSVFTS